MRKRIARLIRRLANWRHAPIWWERGLQSVAHRVKPHELRCKLCGFVSVNDGDGYAHAGRAYDHWESNHALPSSGEGTP